MQPQILRLLVLLTTPDFEVQNFPQDPSDNFENRHTFGDGIHGGQRMEEMVKHPGNVSGGILRYVRLVCDTSGRSCRDEIGRIEACITGFPFPHYQAELDKLISDTGKAVADPLTSSGYRLMGRGNLVRVSEIDVPLGTVAPTKTYDASKSASSGAIGNMGTKNDSDLRLPDDIWLQEIFHGNKPLLLRCQQFQACVQSPGEPFSVWWAKKKAKAAKCQLEEITPEDLMSLELIRGVYDPKLRCEFLRQEEPPLAYLVSIAEWWCAASNVQKYFDSDPQSGPRRQSWIPRAPFSLGV